MHSGQNTEFLNVKLVVHKVSLRLQKVDAAWSTRLYGSMVKFTDHSVLGYTQQKKADAVLLVHTGELRLHTNGANHVIVTIC